MQIKKIKKAFFLLKQIAQEQIQNKSTESSQVEMNDLSLSDVQENVKKSNTLAHRKSQLKTDSNFFRKFSLSQEDASSEEDEISHLYKVTVIPVTFYL